MTTVDEKNLYLTAIDNEIQGTGMNESDQLGVLILACVLATRRLLDAHKITDRGRRMKIMKNAGAAFMMKLREYVVTEPPKSTLILPKKPDLITP